MLHRRGIRTESDAEYGERRACRGTVSVLLVAMPFGALDSPSLALGLLKASLGRIGVDCDVAYLNLAFATRLGIEPYRRIAEGLPQRILAPDWVFSEVLYEIDAPIADGYVRRILGEKPS